MKIKNETELRNLLEEYGDQELFEVLETGEELTIPDILFGYDNQELTLKHTGSV